MVYSSKNIKKTIFANFRMFPASWYILMRLFWFLFLLIKSLRIIHANNSSLCAADVAKASSPSDAYLQLSSGNFSGCATTAAATTVPAATSAATKSARVALLGDGTRALPRLTLPRVVSTTAYLRQMFYARDRLLAGQSHCHPRKRDEVPGNCLVAH